MKELFMPPYPWTQYSNLLIERILHPRNIGFFKESNISMEEMRVVTGKEGSIAEGNYVIFYLVIDETDGVIADVKFQAFGDSALIGAADAACDVIIRKNYDQARRVTAELIDKKLRDFAHIPAFPREVSYYLNLVIDAIENGSEKCMDIPIPDLVTTPPVPFQLEGGESYPDWYVLSEQEKIALIKEVIKVEIQPYIELDAGGIEVKSFDHDREVLIAYQGACTTCPSSTGATLNAIQQILRAKVHPELIVKPDLSLLSY